MGGKHPVVHHFWRMLSIIAPLHITSFSFYPTAGFLSIHNSFQIHFMCVSNICSRFKHCKESCFPLSLCLKSSHISTWNLDLLCLVLNSHWFGILWLPKTLSSLFTFLLHPSNSCCHATSTLPWLGSYVHQSWLDLVRELLHEVNVKWL